MKQIGLACFLVGVAAVALGQEPVAKPAAKCVDKAVVNHIEVPSLPQPREDAAVDRFDHLMEASRHLRAIGLNKEAQRLLKEHGVLAEIESLEARARKLRKLAGAERQVLLKIQVLELSLTKLRAAGIDVPEVLRAHKQANAGQPKERIFVLGKDNKPVAIERCQPPPRRRPSGIDILDAIPTDAGRLENNIFVLDPDQKLLAFFNSLKQPGLLKVLAEPTLVTVRGRPASFSTGGEFPVIQETPAGVTIEYMHYGTQVDVCPTLLADGTVRLEVKVRLSEIDPDITVGVEPNFVPALRVREVETTVVVPEGQTGVISGMVQTRPVKVKKKEPHKPAEDVEVNEEFQTLVLLTPEIVTQLE